MEISRERSLDPVYGYVFYSLNRIRFFFLRGWIRIQSISDRIWNPETDSHYFCTEWNKEYIRISATESWMTGYWLSNKYLSNSLMYWMSIMLEYPVVQTKAAAWFTGQVLRQRIHRSTKDESCKYKPFTGWRTCSNYTYSCVVRNTKCVFSHDLAALATNFYP